MRVSSPTTASLTDHRMRPDGHAARDHRTFANHRRLVNPPAFDLGTQQLRRSRKPQLRLVCLNHRYRSVRCVAPAHSRPQNHRARATRERLDQPKHHLRQTPISLARAFAGEFTPVTSSPASPCTSFPPSCSINSPIVIALQSGTLVSMSRPRSSRPIPCREHFQK